MNTAKDANHPLRLATLNEHIPAPPPPRVRRQDAMTGVRFYTSCCPFCQQPHQDKRDFITCRVTR